MSDLGAEVTGELARLSAVERVRLGELESVVERGLQTFVEVGLALMEIRVAVGLNSVSSPFSGNAARARARGRR